MVLTWTFYPRLGEKVSLKVAYKPELDKFDIWGFLLVENNEAFVSWDCFKVFDRGSTVEKKDAFQRLQRIDTSKMNNGLRFIDIPLYPTIGLVSFPKNPGPPMITLRRSNDLQFQWHLDSIH